MKLAIATVVLLLVLLGAIINSPEKPDVNTFGVVKIHRLECQDHKGGQLQVPICFVTVDVGRTLTAVPVPCEWEDSGTPVLVK